MLETCFDIVAVATLRQSKCKLKISFKKIAVLLDSLNNSVMSNLIFQFSRYEKSAAVCPSNGYPYHQMGLTQLLIATTSGDDDSLMDGLLSCFYYFARSLSVSNRYLPAFQSIENLVKTKVEIMTT